MDPGLDAIALAALFLVLAVGVVWFVKAVVGLRTSSLLISLLVLPALLYLIVSGRLAEFTGPAGIGAKFRALAEKPVQGEFSDLSPERAFVLPKGELASLGDLQADLPPDEPIVLTFILPGGSYEYAAVSQYVEVLAATRRFVLVVFLDSEAEGDRVHAGAPLPRRGDFRLRT